MPFKSFSDYYGVVLSLTKMSSAVLVGLLLFAAMPAAQAEPHHIVGFGDSLMAGYQLPPGESFPERLEKALNERGYEVTIANAGVSGDTTSGGLSRLDWSVPEGTDLVILELGANDMLRGVSPAETEKNLDAIVTQLKERGIKVLLLGMYAAPNLGPDYQKRFDAIYPRLAEKHDVPLVPFFLEGVTGNPSLLLEDGMHPNAEGVEIMVQNVLPALTPFLEGEKTDI